VANSLKGCGANFNPNCAQYCWEKLKDRLQFRYRPGSPVVTPISDAVRREENWKRKWSIVLEPSWPLEAGSRAAHRRGSWDIRLKNRNNWGNFRWVHETLYLNNGDAKRLQMIRAMLCWWCSEMNSRYSEIPAVGPRTLGVCRGDSRDALCQGSERGNPGIQR